MVYTPVKKPQLPTKMQFPSDLLRWLNEFSDSDTQGLFYYVING